MRLPICNIFLDYEGLPAEDFEVSGGLSSESLWRMQGILNALYEYLTDRPVGGAQSLTVEGHRHGRGVFDGRYKARSGSACAAWLPRQSTGDASAYAVFEVLDLSMPQNGAESARTALCVNALCFYCRRDYLTLSYRCRARCGAEAQSACVRMRVLDAEGNLLCSDSCDISGAEWRECCFVCSLPDDDACDGWLVVKLEYGVSAAGSTVELCAADRWNGGGHGAAAEILMQ